VSPASPEYAINVCSFRFRVLSSSAFKIVAPRMAAFEAAMMVKSLPVMPSKTSLYCRQHYHFGTIPPYSHICGIGERMEAVGVWKMRDLMVMLQAAQAA